MVVTCICPRVGMQMERRSDKGTKRLMIHTPLRPTWRYELSQMRYTHTTALQGTALGRVLSADVADRFRQWRATTTRTKGNKNTNPLASKNPVSCKHFGCYYGDNSVSLFFFVSDLCFLKQLFLHTPASSKSQCWIVLLSRYVARFVHLLNENEGVWAADVVQD